MLVTPYVKHQLAVRRFRRDMIRRGYERIDEHRNTLWELHRGSKSYTAPAGSIYSPLFQEHNIVDVKIDIDRKSIWYKTEKVA
jgi:hypothetical protein